MKYLVMFDRDLHDEAVPNRSDIRAHYDQLKREFDQDTGFQGIDQLVGGMSAGDRMILNVSVVTDCDLTQLVEALQQAFDDGAVEGNFNVIGVLDAEPVLVRDKPATDLTGMVQGDEVYIRTPKGGIIKLRLDSDYIYTTFYQSLDWLERDAPWTSSSMPLAY